MWVKALLRVDICTVVLTRVLQPSVKNTGRTWPPESVFSRLKDYVDNEGSPVMRLPAGHELTMRTIKRKEQLIKEFGGNAYRTVSSPNNGKRKEKVQQYPGLEFPKDAKLVCLQPDINPYVPQVPGALGLMFRCGSDEDIEFFANSSRTPQTTFGKTFVYDESLRAFWLYVGDYVFISSSKLSTVEYACLSPRVSRPYYSSHIY